MSMAQSKKINIQGSEISIISQKQEDENDRLKLDWNLQRTLAKVNYHIHTDAIKEKLIPVELTINQISFVYANEADMLNMALFGKTAPSHK